MISEFQKRTERKKKDIVIVGMEAPKDLDGVKILFDFGSNPAATVTVSNIVLKEKNCYPTSVVNNENDKSEVYCEGGRIVIDTEERGEAEIYSVDGKIVKRISLSGGKNYINVAEGIYIVKIGSRNVKCILR